METRPWSGLQEPTPGKGQMWQVGADPGALRVVGGDGMAETLTVGAPPGTGLALVPRPWRSSPVPCSWGRGFVCACAGGSRRPLHPTVLAGLGAGHGGRPGGGWVRGLGGHGGGLRKAVEGVLGKAMKRVGEGHGRCPGKAMEGVWPHRCDPSTPPTSPCCLTLHTSTL